MPNFFNKFSLVTLLIGGFFFLSSCSGGGGGGGGSSAPTAGDTSTGGSPAGGGGDITDGTTTKSASFQAYIVIGAGPYQASPSSQPIGFNWTLTFTDSTTDTPVNCTELSAKLAPSDNNSYAFNAKTCGGQPINSNSIYEVVAVSADTIPSDWFDKISKNSQLKCDPPDKVQKITTCSGVFSFATNTNVTKSASLKGLQNLALKSTSLLKEASITQPLPVIVLNFSKSFKNLIINKVIDASKNTKLSEADRQAYKQSVVASIKPLNTFSASSTYSQRLAAFKEKPSADTASSASSEFSTIANSLSSDAVSAAVSKINDGDVGCLSDNSCMVVITATPNSLAQSASSCTEIKLTGISDKDTITILGLSSTAYFFKDSSCETKISSPFAAMNLPASDAPAGAKSIFFQDTANEELNITLTSYAKNSMPTTIPIKVGPAVVDHFDISIPALEVQKVKLKNTPNITESDYTLSTEQCIPFSITAKTAPTTNNPDGFIAMGPIGGFKSLSVDSVKTSFYDPADKDCKTPLNNFSSIIPINGVYNLNMKFSEFILSDNSTPPPQLTVETNGGISKKLPLPYIDSGINAYLVDDDGTIKFGKKSLPANICKELDIVFVRTKSDLTMSPLTSDEMNSVSNFSLVIGSDIKTPDQNIVIYSDECHTQVSSQQDYFKNKVSKSVSHPLADLVPPFTANVYRIYVKTKTNEPSTTDLLYFPFNYNEDVIHYPAINLIDFTKAPQLSALVDPNLKAFIGDCVPVTLTLTNANSTSLKIQIPSIPNVSFYSDIQSCKNNSNSIGNTASPNFTLDSPVTYKSTIYIKDSSLNDDSPSFTFKAPSDEFLPSEPITVNFTLPVNKLTWSGDVTTIPNSCAGPIVIRGVYNYNNADTTTSSQDKIQITGIDSNLKFYKSSDDCSGDLNPLPYDQDDTSLKASLSNGSLSLYIKGTATNNYSITVVDIDSTATTQPKVPPAIKIENPNPTSLKLLRSDDTDLTNSPSLSAIVLDGTTSYTMYVLDQFDRVMYNAPAGLCDGASTYALSADILNTKDSFGGNLVIFPDISRALPSSQNNFSEYDYTHCGDADGATCSFKTFSYRLISGNFQYNYPYSFQFNYCNLHINVDITYTH